MHGAQQDGPGAARRNKEIVPPASPWSSTTVLFVLLCLGVHPNDPPS